MAGTVLILLLLAGSATVLLTSCHLNPAGPQLRGSQSGTASSAPALAGRSLFLKNCAHCHGDDARGDEGPDLHGLRRSDERLARRIRNGIKGEMPAFGEKFNDDDVRALVAFLHTLD